LEKDSPLNILGPSVVAVVVFVLVEFASKESISDSTELETSAWAAFATNPGSADTSLDTGNRESTVFVGSLPGSVETSIVSTSTADVVVVVIGFDVVVVTDNDGLVAGTVTVDVTTRVLGS
jgi:hypothetical protein